MKVEFVCILASGPSIERLEESKQNPKKEPGIKQ